MTEHLSPAVRAEQILTAARTCFIRSGYFATKVVDIANEAGLSKGGIYFHFNSKREIFRTLVEREYNTAMSFLDEVVSSNEKLINKFRVIGEHFVSLFSDEEQSRFMITIGEMALRDEEVAKLLKDMQHHYFERVAQLLDVAQAHKELSPVNTYATAVVLKALIDGVQLNFALGLEVDHDQLMEAGLIMLTQGLLSSSNE